MLRGIVSHSTYKDKELVKSYVHIIMLQYLMDEQVFMT